MSGFKEIPLNGAYPYEPLRFAKETGWQSTAKTLVSIPVCCMHKNAQWASGVVAFSSQYGETSYGSKQALGACDTATYGDYSTAWAPKVNSGTDEFLSLSFATPVYSTGAVVRESSGSGFLVKVETIDPKGTARVVWEGVDNSVLGQGRSGCQKGGGSGVGYFQNEVVSFLQSIVLKTWRSLMTSVAKLFLRSVPILLVVQSVPVVARAESGGTSLTQKSVPTPNKRPRSPYIPWTFPGSGVTSPSGFGSSWGSAGVGVGFQSRARGTNQADGSFGASFGLGDPNRYVGLDVGVAFYSVRSLSRGGLSLKTSRLLPYGIGVGLGCESVATWGGGGEAPRSLFLSVSRAFWLNYENRWFSALILTAGAGNGRFLPMSKVVAGTNGVNVFGSATIRIREPLSFTADWSGQDLSLGLSITPLRQWGLFINPAITDVTANTGSGARFILGVGFGYNFNS